LRPLFRIAQHPVGVRDRPEAASVSRFEVVGVKALREQAVDALDRLRLGVRADLQGLVVVAEFVVRHLFELSVDASIVRWGTSVPYSKKPTAPETLCKRKVCSESSP